MEAEADKEFCERLKKLDKEYNTTKYFTGSSGRKILDPLHHDNRCPIRHAQNITIMFIVYNRETGRELARYDDYQAARNAAASANALQHLSENPFTVRQEF